jgi:hypothetical protein
LQTNSHLARIFLLNSRLSSVSTCIMANILAGQVVRPLVHHTTHLSADPTPAFSPPLQSNPPPNTTHYLLYSLLPTSFASVYTFITFRTEPISSRANNFGTD